MTEKVYNLALGDVLPVNWQSQLSSQNESIALPVEFIFSLINFCIAEEPMQTKFVAISFVELTLWSVQNLNAQFPVERAKNDQWIFKRPDEMLLKPTVASLTQKVRQGLKTGLKMLGFDNYLCSGLNRQVAGIVIPVEGVLLSIPADVHLEICNISNVQ